MQGKVGNTNSVANVCWYFNTEYIATSVGYNLRTVSRIKILVFLPRQNTLPSICNTERCSMAASTPNFINLLSGITEPDNNGKTSEWLQEPRLIFQINLQSWKTWRLVFFFHLGLFHHSSLLYLERNRNSRKVITFSLLVIFPRSRSGNIKHSIWWDYSLNRWDNSLRNKLCFVYQKFYVHTSILTTTIDNHYLLYLIYQLGWTINICQRMWNDGENFP